MKKPPAFPVYTKDFDTDERVLMMDLAEEGAYFRLLRIQWREGSIPSDHEALAKLLRVTLPRIKALWPRLAPCFQAHPAEPGRLVNGKTERVRQEQQQFLRGKSEAGKKGAAVRYGSAIAKPAIGELLPSVSVAVAVPKRMNERTNEPPPERQNPLVTGRRAELELEAGRLAYELGMLQDKDPIEVMQTAAHYEGSRSSKLNPATMSDDRLANTVLDLRATLAAEKAETTGRTEAGMRPTAAPAEMGKATVYASQEDRDEALERRYDFEHEGFASALAYVSVKSEELAVQFFDWRRRHSSVASMADALLDFESARFGAPLYPAAHGLLWFAVRTRLDPSAGGRVLPKSLRQGPLVAPTPEAIKGLAWDKHMHGQNLSHKEFERREAQLLEQARIVGEDG